MAYPFVAARYFTPHAIVEVRAVLWHMAEGYRTVGYLTHPPSNNSAHFVIERTGRIVQMVKLTDASHSARVAIDPDDADAEDCGIYSDDVSRAVLGTGWSDINRYLVAVEVEGFRADGPNTDQVDAIAALGEYLRAALPTIRGNLGHRDVQDYKGCPGCKFPWNRIGGHGLFVEVDVNPNLLRPALLCAVKGPVTLYADPDRRAALSGYGAFAGGPAIFLFAEAKVAKEPDGQSVLVPILIDRLSGSAEDLVVGWVGTDRVSNVRSVLPLIPVIDTTPYSRADLDAATRPLEGQIERLTLRVDEANKRIESGARVLGAAPGPPV